MRSKKQWAISLAGQGIASFCEDNDISSDEDLEEYIMNDSEDELIELVRTVIGFYLSEMDEDNEWSLHDKVGDIC